MIFQREKKQLWRYASSNSPPASGPQTSPQQLPPHPQPPHRLPETPLYTHQRQLLALQCPPLQSTSTATTTSTRSQQRNTPTLPAYPSSMSYSIDYDPQAGGGNVQTSLAEQQQQQVLLMTHQHHQDWALAEALDDYGKSGGSGYCCENSGDTMSVDVCEQSAGSSHNSSFTTTTTTTNPTITSLSSSDNCCLEKAAKQQLRTTRTRTGLRCNKSSSTQLPTTTTTTTTSASTASLMTSPQICSFAATAANVFRNCCGAGCLSSEPRTAAAATSATNSALQRSPVVDIATTINNNNNCNRSCYGQDAALQQHQQHLQPVRSFARQISSNYNPTDPYKNNYHTLKQQQFSQLMKKLKSRQLTALLQAVKSVRDPNNAAALAAATCSGDGAGAGAAQHLNCILLKRGLSMGEDPYVIVCRLFLWYDLQDADELKRLPVCTNARDPIYICCNPLHWCRIMVPDPAPPPYQSIIMNTSRHEGAFTNESSQNEGNSVTASVHSSSNSFSDSNSNCNDLKSSLQVQIPESFTTDGEGRGACASAVWCEIAYWELAQRVGERFLAEKALVNVYCEGVRSPVPEMCLKDLINKKSSPSPESVLKTRQKIGLGLTLSQESDGVWLYNRSTAPIFLHSPTLNDFWFQVCKIMPGYCVRAFDNHRAREQFLACPPGVLSGAQTGPIDRFSMRISFAKGWGSKYCRQDITACPCWLEVLFTRR